MVDGAVETLTFCTDLVMIPNCFCSSLRSVNFTDSLSTAALLEIGWLIFEPARLALLAALTALTLLLVVGDCDAAELLPALTESLRLLRSFWVMPRDCSREARSTPEKEMLELLLGVAGAMVSARRWVVSMSRIRRAGRMGRVCAMIIYMFFQRRLIFKIGGTASRLPMAVGVAHERCEYLAGWVWMGVINNKLIK